MMTMHPVTSANLVAIGHCPDTLEARVRFANGSEYRYENVPTLDFETLRNAPSVGKQFNGAFKAAFKGIKIEGGPDKETAKANEAMHAESLASLRELERTIIAAAGLWIDAAEGDPAAEMALGEAVDAYRQHPLATKP
jgi:hypothetical protein